MNKKLLENEGTMKIILQNDKEKIKVKNRNYYLNYLNLLQINEQLDLTLKELENEKSNLKLYIQKSEVLKIKNEKTKKNFDDNRNNYFDNDIKSLSFLKRKRRKKNEIISKYVCKIFECKKAYGSEASLKQHIKLKHNQTT